MLPCPVCFNHEIDQINTEIIPLLKISQAVNFLFEKNIFNEVARWPHGCRRQCSEVAVPALVGSNPTEGGGFFRRKETPPGHGCVCMSSRG
jgi:hypothetical protein